MFGVCSPPVHVSHESYLAENLERLGSYNAGRENEAEIGVTVLNISCEQ